MIIFLGNVFIGDKSILGRGGRAGRQKVPYFYNFFINIYDEDQVKNLAIFLILFTFLFQKPREVTVPDFHAVRVARECWEKLTKTDQEEVSTELENLKVFLYKP